MTLKPSEVYYNIYLDNNFIDKWGVFYIGDGDVFIMGHTFIHNKNKIKLEITFINSYNKYNINMIVSNSYEKVETVYYDTVADAININEMLKYWIKYKDYKCTKQFKLLTTINIIEGSLLNKIQYKPETLLDNIIYNKMLKMEDMEYVPFSLGLREKINDVYENNIFDLNEFYNLVFYF
jgi:hypothetical protein